jgi:hypothetical protein
MALSWQTHQGASGHGAAPRVFADSSLLDGFSVSCCFPSTEDFFGIECHDLSLEHRSIRMIEIFRESAYRKTT